MVWLFGMRRQSGRFALPGVYAGALQKRVGKVGDFCLRGSIF
jgi:hypothetical protein